MDLNAIGAGKNPPEEINVVIEVPVGGEPIKYEFDKDSGAIFVDRFLHTPMRYPGNYGFVPHTLCGDGDPIDVVVVNQRPVVPGAIMSCRPIGVLLMEDESGQDEKIIAVPGHKVTKRYDAVLDITDLPQITIDQVNRVLTDGSGRAQNRDTPHQLIPTGRPAHGPISNRKTAPPSIPSNRSSNPP